MRKDGRYYVLDFTLDEVKSLRVHERRNLDGSQVFPDRYQGNGGFRVATFAEQIELIANLNRQFGKNTGLYTEIKSPAWHREQGYDISKITFAALRKQGLDNHDKAIFIQCFDLQENKRLRDEIGAKVKLIQLIADNSWNESTTDYDYLLTDEGLRLAAKYVDGIGPWLPQIVDIESAQPTGLVPSAHRLGLQVHPYTLRKEELASFDLDAVMHLLFNEIQIDGIFTDFSDTVVEFLNQQD
jgi:glycerophosphoryl diester phosphodiesterase